jgi:pyochelin biosynthetic protein PchC
MSANLPRCLVAVCEPAEVEVDLIAFPCAGGGPGMFAGWNDKLPDNWRLRAVCFPGRDVRFNEERATSIAALAGEIAEVLREVPSQGRRVYLGHSMGAVLAFEVASRLMPDVVVTAAAAPPHLDLGCLTSMSDDESMAELRQIIEAAGGAQVTDDPCVFAELTELAAEVLNADLALLDTFTPSTRPISCDIHAYYGADDELPCRPWERETTGQSTANLVAGDHFFVREPPHAFFTDLVLRLTPRAVSP